jgi:DNA-binding winged helix-turn-helix (wHTH) protein/tetratricopeptide (TPR) repeat protein
MQAKQQQIYEFGGFQLDTANHSLSLGGKFVPIKPKSLDTLLFLLRHRGRVVAKDELLEHLWPDTFVEEANLTQTIYELRRALGETAREPKYIENVPKRGYRFNGEVQVLEINAPDPGVVQTAINSLAVLPFCSLQADPGDSAIELGIAETLITGLSSLGRIVVRPFSSTRQFADPLQDPQEAGRTLKVDAVLHGTVQRSKERIRVSARLIETESQLTLWAGRFDESNTDIFLLQDSILEKILTALSLKLTGGERTRLSKRDTVDPEVQALFLKSRYHWYKWTVENWHRSIEYGERAIELDPGHAPSYAWTAASFCNLGIVGAMPPRSAFERAKLLVERSLELDERLSNAHEVLGAIKLFYEWDWQAVPGILQTAIGLNASNASAINLLGLYFAAREDFPAAISELRSAVNIDPLSLLTNTDYGYVLFYSGRLNEAAEQLARALELDNYFAHAHYVLGFVHLHLGEIDRGVDNMRAAVKYSRIPPGESSELGYALALAGNEAEAGRIIETLENKSFTAYVDPYRLALIYSGLRNEEMTLRNLGSAIENRSRELIYIKVNPVFDWLKGNREFEEIIEKLGLN